MRRALSRRRFLARSAWGGAAALFLKDSRLALGAETNSRLRVALIGVGGRGTWFVDTIPRMEDVAAVCDIDDRKIAQCFKRWEELAGKFAVSPHKSERDAAPAFRRLTEENVKAFEDFRPMFDALGAGLDAAIVSIPDHTHATASAAAIRAGKHVFCEKPLTRTVGESRALRDLARAHKVATSMGNQGTASGPFRRALELIRGGALGAVKEVHVWNTSGGADRKAPPTGGEPVPAGFNWELWLGPAPRRPYHREWLQRHLWREFGTNPLGNWGPHSANLAFMALKVHALWQAGPAGPSPPRIRVKAEFSSLNRLSFPRWEKVTWEIPPRAEFPAIVFTWHNGAEPGVRPLLEGLIGDDLDWGDKKDKQWLDHAGAVIVGDKGRMHATGHNATFRLFPAAEFKDVAADRPLSVAASRGHEADWFAACRGGAPAWAEFEYAAPLNEFLMLGNVATQFEEALDFDPIACRIVNNAEADKLLRPEYRAGWTL
ncbi:MAG TPA: Gfo/Idh/MocA family oxidoreductase [Planctomycetota bacterium]|nr:Gfo/Idh/MocA family oxidoreductase [Planctomycetota bacterium]OQC20498.1 MAG: Glucose--fructose oxidoreductase precursor [Planctomycetes bacterium ADurb.Bin069]HNR97976.1 Gfo/Idh/MocA family oxidoreductase [Planctomycetota bacterium]HNU24498.1 Gfo/Idh/MocA family oxidoreductase [Planctomycetota bacterium]HOE29112.1 Gfo/Idh/MocA family oxidoreductase [Planctomycetota bacterium]